MVLESTVICFDNSEDMRNGDFAPTRMQAQQDAANLMIQCKLRSNPENAVGLLSMADRVNVLTTLTTDSNKLFLKLHGIQPNGSSKFLTAIKIAHLVLKHRQNRNHKPRIILFIGSLLEEDDNELIKTAKKFKKEKVNVDIVCFGDESNTNHEKLKAFLETLNGKDGTGSHMIAVPPGSELQQVLMTSPIVRSEDGTAPPVMAVGGGAFFDVDPNEDPELALALRVSLEEQRARQGQQAAAAEGAGGTAAEQPATGEAAPTSEELPGLPANFDELTEEQQIELALQMSLQQQMQPATTTTTAASTTAPPQPAASASISDDTSAGEPMDVGEHSVIASLDDTSVSASTEDFGRLMNDPNALQQLMGTLPGVDLNSEAVQRAVAEAAAGSNQPQQQKGPAKKETKGKSPEEKQGKGGSK